LNCKQRFWKRSKTELSFNLLAEPLSPLKSISFHILLVSVFAAALLKRSSAKLQESNLVIINLLIIIIQQFINNNNKKKESSSFKIYIS